MSKATNNAIHPITESKYLKDKALDERLIQTFYDISDLQTLLDRYIHQNDPRQAYKKIAKQTFFNQFEKNAKALSSDVFEILNSFNKKKQLSDAHIAGRITDPNAEVDNNFFRLQFFVINDALLHTDSKIIEQKDNKAYKTNDILNGYISYLYEMLYDLSSFISEFYNFKRIEYAKYAAIGRLKKSGDSEQKDFPELFKSDQTVPKSLKTKRSHALDLLETSAEVMIRTFYMDNVHVIPVVMHLLRQIIEVRMEEIYGILHITDKSGDKNINIGGTRLLSLEGMTGNVILPLPVDVLKNIYSWACGYVHRGVSSDYWTIYFVRKVLVDFVIGDVFIYKAYQDVLKEKIAAAAGTDAAHVTLRRTTIANVISDRAEFDRLKKLFDSKGYAGIKKEQQEAELKFLQSLKPYEREDKG